MLKSYCVLIKSTRLQLYIAKNRRPVDREKRLIVLAHVRAGAEVVIENGKKPVAIVHSAEPIRRTISECIALLPEESTATLDPGFAKDVEAAIESHREPLDPPTWD